MSHYTLEWILPYVRRIQVGAGANLDYRLFAEQVWSQLEKAGDPGVVRTPPQLHASSGRTFYYQAFAPDLKNATAEAWFYLFRNGYLSPGPPDDYLQAPNLVKGLNVTQRGLAWFSSREPIPEDADSYMTFLAGLANPLDSVIEQYVRESLIAFNRDAHFAAAVMVGAAAEKAVYLLGDAILLALKDPARQKRMKEALGGRSILRLETEINNVIQPLRKSHRDPFEGSETHMMSLFEAIRVQRNDAVHPEKGTVSADSVRMTILAFPHALAKSEELRSWFACHPKSI